MSNRSITFWKCSIFFYIILLGFSGLFLGSVTSFMLVKSFSLRHFYYPIQSSIYFLYAPTFLIFIIAGIGWKSVRRKHYILLKCFSLLQIAVILMEIGGSIWNFVSLQTVHETALPIFQDRFKEMTQQQQSVNWDIIQKKLHCCGIHGAFDYKTLNIVPFSCCNLASSDQFSAFCASLHHMGCLNAFTDNVSQHFSILAVVSATVALFQIPGVFSSWLFANKIKKEKSLDGKKKYCQKLLSNKNKLHQTEGPLIQETIA